MKLIQKIKIYLFTLTTLLVIDGLWLNVFSGHLYKTNLNKHLSSSPNLLAGLIFYLIYAFAIDYLVVFDEIEKPKFKRALFKALVIGIAAYSTFDLTGEAVFKNWPTLVSMIDIAWGSTVTILTAYLTINIFKSKK